MAGNHVVRDHAERVDIAARVHGIAGGLLGAHVLRCAQQLAHCRFASVGHASDAEVRDHGAAGGALEQDISWFDVAVHHAFAVGGRQRPRDLLQHAARLAWRQWSAVCHPLGQRLPVHVRHDVEHVPAHLVDGVNGDDVRMGQSRRRARLAHESVAQLVVSGKVRR